MQKTLILLLSGALFVHVASAKTESDQPLVTIDENLWVMFYDVPSRRFRDIRDAFIRRQFDSASRNLAVGANYLLVEADRALPEIGSRLKQVAARMLAISESIDDKTITVRELDALFARSHWLLAQHYLDMARRSRDGNHHRNAGRYLWATAHHLERTVLWSNSRIDDDVLGALDGMRAMATRLQDAKSGSRPYRNKPIVKADKVLRQLGETLDRQVVLPAE